MPKGTREFIEAARAVMKPSPVRFEHVPSWLRRRILAVYKPTRYNSRKGFYVVRGFCESRGIAGFLDHWGSSKFSNGEMIFVSEPYLSLSDIENAKAFAEELGLEWFISSNAWHFPGNTVRIVFREPRKQEEGR